MESKGVDSDDAFSKGDSKNESKGSPASAPSESKVDYSSSDDLILSRVAAYFYDDDSFLSAIEAFVEEHLPRFNQLDSSSSTEHSLEDYDIFGQYCALIEGRLEAFLLQQSYTLETFHSAIQRGRATEASRDPTDITTVENVATAISAITSFNGEAFVGGGGGGGRI